MGQMGKNCNIRTSVYLPQPVFGEFVAEGRGFHAQRGGGGGLVAGRIAQGLGEELFFGVVDCGLETADGQALVRVGRAQLGGKDFGRDVSCADEVCPLERVVQFADVARPVVAGKQGLGVGVDLQGSIAGDAR